MAITLTTNAARHVEKMLQKHADAIGLRLGTRKSGCTGFAYVVDYANSVENDDIVFESNGIKIIVDQASLGNIQGTEIDFVRTNLLNEGFEFRNPNVKDMCGCGESFSV